MVKVLQTIKRDSHTYNILNATLIHTFYDQGLKMKSTPLQLSNRCTKVYRKGPKKSNLQLRVLSNSEAESIINASKKDKPNTIQRNKVKCAKRFYTLVRALASTEQGLIVIKTCCPQYTPDLLDQTEAQFVKFPEIFSKCKSQEDFERFEPLFKHYTEKSITHFESNPRNYMMNWWKPLRKWVSIQYLISKKYVV